MKILRESMTRFKSSRFTIRVWREETPDVKIDRQPFIKVIQAAAESSDSTEEVSKAILKEDRVNAVEVLDQNGNGDVLYRDWP